MITFHVPALFSSVETHSIQLLLLDTQQRKIRRLSGHCDSSGQYTIRWDGRDGAGKPVASGVYFLRLEAPDFLQIKRIVVLR
jgi:hypothetical protein